MDQGAGTAEGDQALVFRGRIEESDFVAIRRCLWRVTLRRSIRWLAGGLLTFLAVASAIGLGIGWYLWAKLPLSVWLMGGFWISLWTYVLFIMPLMSDRQARRWYRSHESEFRDTMVSLGPNRIVIESDRLNQDYDWTIVKRIAEAPEGFLFLSIDNALLIWLPDRLFTEAETRPLLATLTDSAGVPIRRLV